MALKISNNFLFKFKSARSIPNSNIRKKSSKMQSIKKMNDFENFK